MNRWLFILLLVLLSSCAVEFRSDQYDAIKKMITGDKRFAESQLWYVFFEGQEYRAIAVKQQKKDVTFVSMDYLEVDFKHTYVAAIRMLSPQDILNTIVPTATGMEITNGNVERPITLLCDPLAQVSEYVYFQPCKNEDLAWFFRNELQVDAKREVVYIKTYYSPSKPPIEMYDSFLFKRLNKNGR